MTRVHRFAALIVAAGLVLAGCGEDAPHRPEEPHVMVVNGIEPQSGLLPATADVAGGVVLDQLFAGLVAYDADGRVVNEVASSIESEDFKRWVIRLNPEWTFTDGTPVTASSFVDAWNVVANGDEARARRSFTHVVGYEAVRKGDAETLKGLTAKGDATIVIKLDGRDSDFVRRLGSRDFYPLPDAAFDDPEAFGRAPVGNGPYRLATDEAWQLGEELELAVNDDYDGARVPRNDGLRIVFYDDLNEAYADVQSGDLDVLDTVPVERIAGLDSDEKVQSVREAGSDLQSLVVPQWLDHFAGKEGRLRRRAISVAIDRETVVQSVFDGARVPAVDFSTPLLPGFRDDLENVDRLRFDADRAKRFWEQADDISAWKGTFQIAYNADGDHKAWVEAVAEQIRTNLDIKVKTEPYDSFEELGADVVDRTIGSAYREGWQPDYPSVLNYLRPRFVTGEFSNGGDYSSRKVDVALKKARLTEEEDERWDLAAEAQTVLLDQLPAIPLWYSGVVAALAEGVGGAALTWQGTFDYTQLTIDAS